MKRIETILALVATAIAILPGCQQANQGPYETGLTVTTEATETRVTRSYLIREGDDEPLERKGTIGVGDECSVARGSSGVLTVTETGTVERTFKVVGQTESSHPLVPGTDTYGTAGVSIVESQAKFDGDTFIEETFRDPTADPSSWESTSNAELSRTSDSAFTGVAADEYVVGFNSLGDLWGDLEADLSDPDSDMDLELITRKNAQANDIWSSLDGEMLYFATDSEELSFGGEKFNATRVDVHTVADPDPEAGNLVDKCIGVNVLETVNSHPGVDNGSVLTATVDPGCDSAFVHQEVGSEWWYGNVLVQAEKETYEVTITAFGYDHFEDNGGGCSRVISPTRDDSDAKLFVEYTVTTISSELHTTDYRLEDGQE